MTNAKIALVSLIVLFGSALCAAANIQLSVYPSSNAYWIAVSPIGGSLTTSKIELQQSGSSAWSTMEANPDWGYWQLASTGSQTGFKLPLSFRMTASNGQQVILSSVVGSIGGATINTQTQYGGSTSTQAPSPCNNGPTEAPEHGHQPPPATQAPTQHATQAPTQHATQPPHNTQAPTQHATQAPTQHGGRHTQAPTQRATSAPTQHATQAPTQHSTPVPTQRATAAPTQHATQKPTSAPTQKATSPPNNNLCGVPSTATEPVKFLVPLYIYPDSTWDQVIAAQKAGVETIAIINPNDGPESSGPDSSYRTYMTKMAAAGVTMIGYIHTLYGDRNINDVIADINTYATKYPGLAGIFVDEASASAGDVAYYKQVYNAVLSHSGYVHSILNPGTQPDQGYLDAGSSIVIYEDQGKNWKGNYASWVKCAPNAADKAGYKYKFSGIAYASSQSQMASLIPNFVNAGIGMVYVTDGAPGGMTYNSLPAYWDAMVSAIKAAN